jgi:poly(3-hydroxybutyrate) depolymerase
LRSVRLEWILIRRGYFMLFKKLRLAVTTTALAVVCLVSPLQAGVLDHSVAGSVSDGSASIPYRLFEPQNTAPGQKVPLILYLHGMGDRGTDNTAQTTWMGNLTARTSSGQYAAYVLAPQIDTNMWFSSSTSAPTEAMSLTMMALHQAMNNPNIDTSRVYVTGASMGAFGTWDILRRDPGVFAAAVPMSGGGDPSTADLGVPWIGRQCCFGRYDPQHDRRAQGGRRLTQLHGDRRGGSCDLAKRLRRRGQHAVPLAFQSASWG